FAQPMDAQARPAAGEKGHSFAAMMKQALSKDGPAPCEQAAGDATDPAPTEPESNSVPKERPSARAKAGKISPSRPTCNGTTPAAVTDCQKAEGQAIPTETKANRPSLGPPIGLSLEEVADQSAESEQQTAAGPGRVTCPIVWMAPDMVLPQAPPPIPPTMVLR